MLTFTKLDQKFQRYRHIVSTVGLSYGDQGIPDGFCLTALCGESKSESALDIFPLKIDEKEKMCPVCEGREKERRRDHGAF